MPTCRRWKRFILHRMFVLDGEVRAAYRGYEFIRVLRAVLDFCNADLSALYFDIRKDALYCDRPDSLRRRACRTVMDEVFARLTMWLAPLTPFTMEEAWEVRFPDAGANALRVMPEVPAEWENEAESARWENVQKVVGYVNERLEEKRRDKELGSALEAAPTVSLSSDAMKDFHSLDAAEVFRTSSATVQLNRELTSGWVVKYGKATGHKCERCWRILPEVTAPKFLCERCDDAVQDWDQHHAA